MKILDEIMVDFCSSVDLTYLSTYLNAHGLLGLPTAINVLGSMEDRQEKVSKAFLTLKQKGEETPQKLLCCLFKEKNHSGHECIAKKLKGAMQTYNLQPYCPVCKKEIAV